MKDTLQEFQRMLPDNEKAAAADAAENWRQYLQLAEAVFSANEGPLTGRGASATVLGGDVDPHKLTTIG
jgi:hypothetical protein